MIIGSLRRRLRASLDPGFSRGPQVFGAGVTFDRSVINRLHAPRSRRLLAGGADEQAAGELEVPRVERERRLGPPLGLGAERARARDHAAAERAFANQQ